MTAASNRVRVATVAYVLFSFQLCLSAAETPRDAFRYRSACGPIAGFVALRTMGCDVSLEEVVRGCRSDESGATSLAKLCSYLDARDEVNCRGVWIPKNRLQEHAASDEYIPILVVRNGSETPDHVICVTDGAVGHVKVVGYPELAREVELAEIARRWDGQALLVSRDWTFEIATHWRYFLPAAAVMLAAVWPGMFAGRRWN